MSVSNQRTVLVTGSSGYVGSYLVPTLSAMGISPVGVDLRPDSNTTYVGDISDGNFRSQLSCGNGVSIVNLAAARFDFGARAEEYYKLNVECHEKFLLSLTGIRVETFVHVSSVAALDGRYIPFSERLGCDDAYRSTKYLQEVMIQKWCDEHDVDLTILYPSAIFSDDPRSDTNIGKLQSISKYIPFIPKIRVTKSLTYLPIFTQFITDAVTGEIPSGKYLTIEQPSLTVSKILQIISGRSIKVIRIPLFSVFLRGLACVLYVLGFFGRIDLKLTPNRVVKLFSDTSYDQVGYDDIDKCAYASRSGQKLPEILEEIARDDNNAQ